ncbi:MAG: SDR family oxidoreductase [Ignavibacteria bacterium]|nr:SDR family oxidoreductase [Ignavibacteria bacterium]
MSGVLILGSGSLIARACASEFASRNYNVYFAGRNKTEAEKLANDFHIRYEIKSSGFEFDATNFGSHKDFINNLFELANDIEYVLIAFGYLGKQEISQENFSEAEKVIDTNLTGVVSVCELIASYFIPKSSGTIAVISSVAGDRGGQSNYIYGSAKAGLSAYLSGLRSRLCKNNIHVLTVKPGFVDTPMTYGMKIPKLLLASPEKVGKDIFKAMLNKKNVIYTPFYWKWIMFIVKLIPESIFKKLKI